MEVTAIRPDRDVIGKQKNPRKKKLLLLQQKTELNNIFKNTKENNKNNCCLPSPGTESNRFFLGHARLIARTVRHKTIKFLNICEFRQTIN